MKLFTTDERRLEQFLFAHLIRFDRQRKDERGYTVWEYAVTPRLLRVVQEYRDMMAEYGA